MSGLPPDLPRNSPKASNPPVGTMPVQSNNPTTSLALGGAHQAAAQAPPRGIYQHHPPPVGDGIMGRPPVLDNRMASSSNPAMGVSYRFGAPPSGLVPNANPNGTATTTTAAAAAAAAASAGVAMNQTAAAAAAAAARHVLTPGIQQAVRHAAMYGGIPRGPLQMFPLQETTTPQRSPRPMLSHVAVSASNSSSAPPEAAIGNPFRSAYQTGVLPRPAMPSAPGAQFGGVAGPGLVQQASSGAPPFVTMEAGGFGGGGNSIAHTGNKVSPHRPLQQGLLPSSSTSLPTVPASSASASGAPGSVGLGGGGGGGAS
ncbi:unnamed protein product, partial [Laminaria digitata]